MGSPVPYLPTPTPEGHTFDPADSRHGLPSSYSNYKCRCLACKAGWAERQREYMARKPDQRFKAMERNRLRKESR